MLKQRVPIPNVFLDNVNEEERCFKATSSDLDFSVPGPQNTNVGTDTTRMYLMLGIWLAIAFLLFFFRPRTMRNHREPPSKTINQVSSIL